MVHWKVALHWRFFFTMNRHEPNGSPCLVVNQVGPAGPADPQEKWPVFYEALSYEPRKLETDWEAANNWVVLPPMMAPVERPLNHGNMKVFSIHRCFRFYSI